MQCRGGESKRDAYCCHSNDQALADLNQRASKLRFGDFPYHGH